jgi:hypothetical protein
MPRNLDASCVAMCRAGLAQWNRLTVLNSNAIPQSSGHRLR